MNVRRIQAVRLVAPEQADQAHLAEAPRYLSLVRSMAMELASMHPISIQLQYVFPGSVNEPVELFLRVDAEAPDSSAGALMPYLEQFFPSLAMDQPGEDRDPVAGCIKALPCQADLELCRDAELLLRTDTEIPAQPVVESLERLFKLRRKMVLTVGLRSLSKQEADAVLPSLYGLRTLGALRGDGAQCSELCALDPDAPDGENALARLSDAALLHYDIRVHADHPPDRRLAAIVSEMLQQEVRFVNGGNDRRLPIHAINAAAILQAPVARRPCLHLRVDGAPALLPPIEAASSGIKLGRAEVLGEHRDICLHDDDVGRHVYVVGKTGAGKSTLLASMILSAVDKADRAVFVLDPHGDLAHDVLNAIPERHAQRVLFIDFGNTKHFPGVNILEARTDAEREFAIGELDQMFLQMYGPEIWGPRLQDAFRNLALLLAADEDGPGTLLDLVWAIDLQDDNIRARFERTAERMPVGPSLRLFMDQILAQKTGDGSLRELKAYYRAKFSPFADNLYLRNILGQKRSTLDFKRLARTKAVCVFNLNKGAISARYANLIGRILTTKILQAALSTGSLPPTERPATLLFLDEFQNLVSPSIEDILSEARKFNMSMVLANQFLSQISNTLDIGRRSHMLDAILGNVGSLVAFRLGHSDARRVASELGEAVTPEQIAALPNWRAVCALSNHGVPMQPFVCETTPVTGAVSNCASRIIARSEATACTAREDVEKEIEQRFNTVRGVVRVPTDPMELFLRAGSEQGDES